MNSEICFSTLEVLHCLLVCLALSFFSHVCFEKAGIPQKEAGVGLVGGVCWIEWRERIDYGKTCGWTSDRPILSPPCGGCKGCLLKMSCLSRSVGPWHAVLRWGAGSGVSKGCIVLPTAFFFFCHLRRLECVLSRQRLFLFKTYLSSCKKTKRKSSPRTVHPTISIFLWTKFFSTPMRSLWKVLVAVFLTTWNWKMKGDAWWAQSSWLFLHNPGRLEHRW